MKYSLATIVKFNPKSQDEMKTIVTKWQHALKKDNVKLSRNKQHMLHNARNDKGTVVLKVDVRKVVETADGYTETNLQPVQVEVPTSLVQSASGHQFLNVNIGSTGDYRWFRNTHLFEALSAIIHADTTESANYNQHVKLMSELRNARSFELGRPLRKDFDPRLKDIAKPLGERFWKQARAVRSTICSKLWEVKKIKELKGCTKYMRDTTGAFLKAFTHGKQIQKVFAEVFGTDKKYIKDPTYMFVPTKTANSGASKFSATDIRIAMAGEATENLTEPIEEEAKGKAFPAKDSSICKTLRSMLSGSIFSHIKSIAKREHETGHKTWYHPKTKKLATYKGPDGIERKIPERNMNGILAC